MRADESGLTELVAASRGGDSRALDSLVRSLLDDVYGLALRMTANVADAEDATQEIMIKVITRLDSFKSESSVRTWVYRIAVHHLLDRKRSRVESFALNFEQFAADLHDGLASSTADADAAAVEEVKLGCTLAMLTCLDRNHRIAYILGEVFDLQGAMAASIMGVTEEVYRQRVSRARRQLEAFTESYCGVVNPRAACACDRRVVRAIELGRVHRDNLVLAKHSRCDVQSNIAAMEGLHAAAALFRTHPHYAAPAKMVTTIRDALATDKLEILR